jgi:hypothetical protein
MFLTISWCSELEVRITRSTEEEMLFEYFSGFSVHSSSSARIPIPACSGVNTGVTLFTKMSSFYSLIKLISEKFYYFFNFYLSPTRARPLVSRTL